MVEMDDFEIALEQTWLRAAKAIISSHSEQLLLLLLGDQCIQVVDVVPEPPPTFPKLLSVLQVKRAVWKGAQLILATLVEKDEEGK